MKKSILNLLLAAGMTLGAVGFAQTETLTEHTSPVVAPTYLGLGYVQGALQVSTSSTGAASLSPEVLTIAFKAITYKDGRQPAGFRALHADTTLSEVVSYYWEALSELGFTSSVDAGSRSVTSYRFENGDSRLLAVFTQDGGNVVADLSWIGAESVATAY